MSDTDITILHDICRWVLAVRPIQSASWLEVAAELRRAAELAEKQVKP